MIKYICPLARSCKATACGHRVKYKKDMGNDNKHDYCKSPAFIPCPDCEPVQAVKSCR